MSIVIAISVFSLISFLLSVVLIKFNIRAFPFLLFLFQFFVYIIFVPIIGIAGNERPLWSELLPQISTEELERNYFILMITFFLFFYLPLITTFIFCKKLFHNAHSSELSLDGDHVIYVNYAKLSILLVLWSGLVFWTFLILQGEGVLLERHSMADIDQFRRDLPIINKIIVRSVQESYIGVSGVFLLCAIFSTGFLRILTWCFFVTLAILAIIYGTIHSKMFLIVFVTINSWLFFSFTNKKYSLKLKLCIFVLLAILIVILFSYSSSLRLNAEGITRQYPVLFDQQGMQRLNGIDFMATILPQFWESGPLFGGLLDYSDPDLSLISLGANTSKMQLLYSYYGYRFEDYVSCCLVDVFGNFSILGLFIFSVFVGVAYFFIGSINRCRKAFKLVLLIFLFSLLISFEHEGRTMVSGWVRFLPILVLIFFCNPLEIKSKFYKISS